MNDDTGTNALTADERSDLQALLERQQRELDAMAARLAAMPAAESTSYDEPAMEGADDARSTRRNLLRASAAVVGAGIAASTVGVKSAAAANGDDIEIGAANDGTSTTSLTVPGNGLSAFHGIAEGNLSNGLRGESSGNGGRGVFATCSGNLGDAIRAEVVGGAAGTAVRAIGSNSSSGTGVIASGAPGRPAVAAVGAVSVVTQGESENLSPVAPIHVQQTGSPDPVELLLQLESDVPPQQIFLNNTTSAKWFFAMTSDDEFKISRDGTGVVEAKFFKNGNLALSGSLIQASDANIKHDFAPVDADAVLDAITAMPVGTWRYDSDPDTVHMGPTSQDFAAAFELGDTDTGIAAVDADGVALAAIQALAEKNRRLESEVAELRELLTAR